MKTINAATDLFNAVEVDVWGKKYGVVEPTRAVERRTEAALDAAAEVAKNPDATDDELFAVEVEVLDAVLDPIPGEDGKKERAKTYLKRLYKSEKIGRAHVERLYLRVAEAREENVPF